jgi:hypothetical protein
MGKDPVLCPECGWSGDRTDLVETPDVESCPVCDTDIEFVD